MMGVGVIADTLNNKEGVVVHQTCCLRLKADHAALSLQLIPYGSIVYNLNLKQLHHSEEQDRPTHAPAG